jgi:hypothetical protein
MNAGVHFVDSQGRQMSFREVRCALAHLSNTSDKVLLTQVCNEMERLAAAYWATACFDVGSGIQLGPGNSPGAVSVHGRCCPATGPTGGASESGAAGGCKF